jgi:hypothetical protein
VGERRSNMVFDKPSWRNALLMLRNDRSGDLIALVFSLVLAIAVVALLPI